MTGGQEPSDKKRRFEEAEVENLRTLAEKFKADIEALPKGHKRQSEEEALVSEMTGLEARAKYAQDELKALQRNLESKGKELEHARRQLADAKPKFEEQAQALEDLRESLEEHASAIAEVEDQVFAAFCARLG
ncbi:Structural maintenance of chromosomes protein 1B, partial [Friedmanniomyces endolithicus]